ncbi:putative lipoprotein [Streptomyces lanatus]|nr:putative lipoprotein [Streptomyces lanatus]
MVVHGEREILPSATKAEAAKALQQFTVAYNKADKAFDSSLDADFVTGGMGEINAAQLKAGKVLSPSGNSAHTPLELSDVKITIPKKAGWPRWFVADAAANKIRNARWLFVFTRSGLDDAWEAAYLTLVAPDDVPEFKTDKDGWAEAVSLNSTELAVPPKDLSKEYAGYLKDGGDVFASGRHTSEWRADRKKDAKRPGLATQFIDEPLTDGDYAPVALRTADGDAMVFFTTRYYEKRTAYAGTSVPSPGRAVEAVTTGEIKQSLTMEIVSNEIAIDPKGSGKVELIGRTQGLTSAKGE